MLDIGFLPDLQRILSYLPKQRTTLLFFSPPSRPKSSAWPAATCKTGHHRGGAAQRDRVHGGAAFLQRQRRGQAPRHPPGAQEPRDQAGLHLRQQQARLRTPGPQPGARRPQDHRAARRQSQDERLKALEAFKNGASGLLVCTDVAARGLDIRMCRRCSTSMCPSMPKTMCTRIGRTGRAGASGLAVTLVSGSDARLVADIEKLLKKRSRSKRSNTTKTSRTSATRAVSTMAAATGARARRKGQRPAAAPERERSPRGQRGGFRPAPVSRDPFFDKPYETPAEEVKPAWEATERAATGRISPNIKPKRKVAALFKAPTRWLEDWNLSVNRRVEAGEAIRDGRQGATPQQCPVALRGFATPPGAKIPSADLDYLRASS